jgi:hypothetical protein
LRNSQDAQNGSYSEVSVEESTEILPKLCFISSGRKMLEIFVLRSSRSSGACKKEQKNLNENPTA